MTLKARLDRLERSAMPTRARIATLWLEPGADEEAAKAELIAREGLTDEDLIIVSLWGDLPPAPAPLIIETDGRPHEQWLHELA